MVAGNVTIPWCDSSGLAVLQQWQDLRRAKRLVDVLTLATSALIAAIASITVAAVALTQQVHTAQFVNNISRNVSLTLASQEIIDSKLEMEVDTLEEAVMHIGTELQALIVKLALSCHADCRWICITPLQVNETDYNWEWIKSHITGIWNSSSIGLDLENECKQIQALEHSRLDFTSCRNSN